ncbi:MAG: hypothetical protein ACK4FS_03500 [Flavobacterium sp.]
MNKENLKSKLKELKVKKDKLTYLLKKEFNSEEEFYKFKEENIFQFNQLKELTNEIKQIEWELMSEKEKQEYIEYQKKIKEKYSED